MPEPTTSATDAAPAAVEDQPIRAVSFNLDSAPFRSVECIQKGAIDRRIAREFGQPLRVKLATREIEQAVRRSV